ncbi:hypothetical protein DRE_00253 [Drechslerella stenobrocha 248]|uniref:Small nuclear ribonucleoprotein Prp3 C-terminal domain-containing protein n=1 Tax=Drechslerella stenobrocha 248 TaxID=1043628 RepID=W7I9E6_9PEZI|nr:hypothetical protein DRE_00253 [Drechslerella stenobrocha 248]
MLFARVFFMFHHIRAPRKRELIQSLAKSMSLTGVCKHGSPGFLYVEGEALQVQAYIKEIKRMRWQSVEVRRKEQETLADNMPLETARRLTGPFGVVEVESSGEMSEKLQAVGLADFLHKAMTRTGP